MHSSTGFLLDVEDFSPLTRQTDKSVELYTTVSMPTITTLSAWGSGGGC